MLNLRPLSARREAFTLIELIVASAVFMLMAVLIFSVVGMVSSISQQGQSKIDTRKTGRTVVDRVGRELEEAVLPVNRAARFPSVSLTAAPEGAGLGYQLLVNPPQLSASYRNPNALFFQTPIWNGEIAEVGYFIRWDQSRPENPRGMLCRFFSRQGEAAYRIDTQPLDWINDGVIEQVAPGVENLSTPELSFKGHFADNVIGLWVRCLDPDGSPIVRTMADTPYSAPTYGYDSRKGYRYTPRGTSTAVLKKGWVVSPSEVQAQSVLPPVIQMVIVVLDSPAAKRLTQKPTYPLSAGLPTAASFWKDIDDFVAALPAPVRQGARVYSTQVALKNAD